MHYPEDHRIADAKAKDIASVLDMLGVQGLVRTGHEMVGPCPQCGGRDRFGVNIRKGVFGCRRCDGKGGVIDLVMFVLGKTFPQALDWLCGPRQELSDRELAERARKAEENRRRNEARAERERQKAIRMAKQVWAEAGPAEDTPVRDYLSRRGIARDLWPVLPKCLRFHPALPYTVRGDRGWRSIYTGPAMVAAVQGPDGVLGAVHRTWIDLDQPKGKAILTHPQTGEVMPSKKVLGSKKGGAIRLSGNRVSPVMVMGEGIETTASALVAQCFPDACYWAGVDLGNMSGWRVTGKGQKFAGIPDLDDERAFLPPGGVQRLIFIQDGDSDPRETRAKLEAGLRRAMVMRPGLIGQIVHAGQGVDLNDVLMGASDG